MKKPVVAIVIGLVSVSALAFVLISSNSSEPSQSESNQTNSSTNSSEQLNNNNDQAEVTVGDVSVDIKNFAFSPATITIKKGSKVTWTNQDSAKHDVTPVETSENFEASELLARGESYSYTFDTVGTYDYICSPHPYMKAKVVVVE